MRHNISGNKLNRKTSHRKATIRDMAKATLIRQRICTTKAKAKEARSMVDKLITLGKNGTLADKRRAFAILCDHPLVSKLFNKIAGRFTTRKGGYTRIIPLGNRRGDNAELVYLELTEKEEIVISKQKKKKTEKEGDKAPDKSELKKPEKSKNLEETEEDRTRKSEAKREEKVELTKEIEDKEMKQKDVQEIGKEKRQEKSKKEERKKEAFETRGINKIKKLFGKKK